APGGATASVPDAVDRGVLAGGRPGWARGAAPAAAVDDADGGGALVRAADLCLCVPASGGGHPPAGHPLVRRRDGVREDRQYGGGVRAERDAPRGREHGVRPALQLRYAICAVGGDVHGLRTGGAAGRCHGRPARLHEPARHARTGAGPLAPLRRAGLRHGGEGRVVDAVLCV
ncbi:MAG: hypothetical protein AVDCRST_MAG77-5131, partial [uncultured Chloroflexi bacterium]